MKLEDIERSFPILIKILSITSDKENWDIYANISVNKNSSFMVKVIGFQIWDSYFYNKEDIDKNTEYNEWEISLLYEDTAWIEHSISLHNIYNLHALEIENEVEESVERTLTTINRSNQENIVAIH